ncbi:MAG TPA: OmpA family protein [Deltaproteobacteria bacterium]|nr:OmpA family protein [Deltaproteobacteria bacterium]HOM29803.1 OmpA family protein [Deltaproteobacteria bacterium]HPP79715.1 OmpA family protein [Deltaproteobacteria bacterium]
MNRIILILSSISMLLLASGCARHTLGEENSALTAELAACRSGMAKAGEENERLKAELSQARSKLEAAQTSLSESMDARQELLDKNIRCMEENQALLKQISRFKTLTQERKDALARLTKAEQTLLSSLERERQANLLYVVKTESAVTVVIPQSSLFPSEFSAWLTPKGIDLVRKVAKAIKDMRPSGLSVAGHTDGQPLPPSVSRIYPTLWDLAMARSVAVLNVLEAAGIGKEKLSAVSYADTRPMADEKTDAGRAMNRRVEIVVLP